MENSDFSPRLIEGKIDTDDWKRDRIFSGIENTINTLCSIWNIEKESILGNEPIEIDIYGEGAEIERDRIKISDPDSYRAMMRNLFDDKKVIETTDSHYPIPFHEVPEEVGQIIGERANNTWTYENEMESMARDELHGAMGVSEFFPWFIDRELQVLEENLSIILELNSEDHIEYLDYLQGGKLNRLKNRLEEISERDDLDSTYRNALKTGILNEATDILENRPETESSPIYTHEEMPEDFSERILEEYLSLDELAEYENIEKVLNDESSYSIEDITENIEIITEFDYNELETLQERINTSLNTKRDRAYLISRRLAKQIYGEEMDLSPTQVVTSNPETDEILRQSIYTADRQIKSEYDL
jgi:hypothetical protein